MNSPKVCRIPIAALKMSAPATTTSVALSLKAKNCLRTSADIVLVLLDRTMATSGRSGKGEDLDDG